MEYTHTFEDHHANQICCLWGKHLVDFAHRWLERCQSHQVGGAIPTHVI